MAAGVGANVLLALICLMGMIIIISGVTPAINGVYVYSVVDDGPAQLGGIQIGDVFVSVDNLTISSYSDIQDLFKDKEVGEVVSLTVARGEGWKDYYSTNVTLIESEGRAIMGVGLGDLTTDARLQQYQTLSLETFTLYLIPPALAPGFVPFSDSLSSFYSSPLGPQWAVYVNILFWIWFVNINVAVFNALPLYPMDGGRIFDITLKQSLNKKASEKTIHNITIAVTLTIVLILAMIIAIPFLF